MWCSGVNAGLAAGLPSGTHAVPTEVSGVTDAIQISMGDLVTCALRASGGVACWGDNFSGGLGAGSAVTTSGKPLQVWHLTGAKEISVGPLSSCARTATAVKCWGNGYYGVLGDRQSYPSRAPVTAVVGLSSPTSVAVGETVACEIAGGGRVWCWGYNAAGEAGNGSTDSALRRKRAVLMRSALRRTEPRCRSRQRPGQADGLADGCPEDQGHVDRAVDVEWRERAEGLHHPDTGSRAPPRGRPSRTPVTATRSGHGDAASRRASTTNSASTQELGGHGHRHPRRRAISSQSSASPLTATRTCVRIDRVRWEAQTLDAPDAGALPGLAKLHGLVRSVTTPEFAGVTFHEVMSKSALNKVPAGGPMPFAWTVNPYRGCSHACVYCFARPSHQYLDFDAGRDFDTQVIVKINVAEQLRRELARPTWSGEPVALGTNTDPYQRAEGRYRLMPGIIRALADSGTPFSILTKGTLLRRDLPLLADAATRRSGHARHVDRGVR